MLMTLVYTHTHTIFWNYLYPIEGPFVEQKTCRNPPKCQRVPIHSAGPGKMKEENNNTGVIFVWRCFIFVGICEGPIFLLQFISIYCLFFFSYHKEGFSCYAKNDLFATLNSLSLLQISLYTLHITIASPQHIKRISGSHVKVNTDVLMNLKGIDRVIGLLVLFKIIT